MAPVAKEFDKIIKDGRERRRNEALATRIFSRDRRQSAPAKLKAGAGPSLASRVGVRKASQRTITPSRRTSFPAANVGGEWTQDLHTTATSAGRHAGDKKIAAAPSRSKMAPPPTTTRVSLFGRAVARKARADAMDLDDDDDDDYNNNSNNNNNNGRGGGKAAATARSQVNVVSAAQGISIRGLAGPFAVLGQNFAPGTTPADVESAMTPIGGEMVSCKVVKTQPFLMMEMVFVSKEGAERVIDMFDNKTADGRILKVFPKIPGSSGFKDQQQVASGGGSTSNNSNSNNNNNNIKNNRNNSGNGNGHARVGSDLFSDKAVPNGRGGRDRRWAVRN